MKSYFLSYARDDQAVARRFADDLIGAGVNVWVDQYEIRPSQSWDREVEAAVRGCDGMIVLLSPRSAASPNVADEVSVAIETGKDIIPILIAACTIPLRLTRMQFIDATRDYEEAYRRCLAATGEPLTPMQAAQAHQSLSDEILQEAERRLMAFMGPIAGRLVKAAGLRAATKAELYRDLAQSIPAAAERRSFMAGVSEPGPLSFNTPDATIQPAAPAHGESAISPNDVQAITTALLRHLGPIAPRLVQREKAHCRSKQDLCARLGEHIPADRDRKAFLREVGLG